jgi:HK97 gp10 family phage protein
MFNHEVMASFTLGITGLDKLKAKFASAADNLDKHIAKSINQSLTNIQQEAKANAPYRTGALQRSITHRKVDKTNSGFISAGNALVKYAPYQEFGTRNVVRLPTLRNLTTDQVTQFAMKFQKTNIKKYTNVPASPFLLTAFDKEYSRLVYTIKQFKI